MSRLAYDLHVHSCLSPCADDDMTPHSIAGMARINGLSIVALTDHNACDNCPAFFAAADGYGVTPVAGMELTTAEDIHLVCLFETLGQAMAFSEQVGRQRVRVRNRPAVFGRQLAVDACDAVRYEEPDLLINATGLSLEAGTRLCRDMGGAAVPAHVDREGNGMLAILGAFPQAPAFGYVELNERAKRDEVDCLYGLGGRRVLVSSDAHNLWRISEAVNRITLDADADADAQSIRTALIRTLRGEGGA